MSVTCVTFHLTLYPLTLNEFTSGSAKMAQILLGGCHGRDGMVVGFTTTCAISAYHH